MDFCLGWGSAELQWVRLLQHPAPLSCRDQPTAVTPFQSTLSRDIMPQMYTALRKPSTNTSAFPCFRSLFPSWLLLLSQIHSSYCVEALEVLPSWTAVVSEIWSGRLAWDGQETWICSAIYWKILRHTYPLLLTWCCLTCITFTHSAHTYVRLPQIYQSLSWLSFNLSSSSIASTYQLCSSGTSQHVAEGVCVSVQCISMERCGEAPERGSDTWEQIHLDGAGGTNTLLLLPVQKLAWLCFQGMHCIYKCTVSCLARTAAIFPLQPSCPTQRWM